MSVKQFISGSWTVIKNSAAGFVNDKVPKLSGSLSYYMIFSMGPLLLIIITLCSAFFGREAIEGSIYKQLEGFTGHDTAIQLQQIKECIAEREDLPGHYCWHHYPADRRHQCIC